MFEHKNLDGEWNRIIPSNEAFLKGDILECRDTAGTDAKAMSRRQYSVVGDRLVERCLPPETIGDFWSFDATGTPWWGSVKNPPHMGLIAEFNSHLGGEHRKPIDLAHNVVAFATAGEEVTFANGIYTVVRKSDDKEITANSLIDLRLQYAAD